MKGKKKAPRCTMNLFSNLRDGGGGGEDADIEVYRSDR